MKLIIGIILVIVAGTNGGAIENLMGFKNEFFRSRTIFPRGSPFKDINGNTRKSTSTYEQAKVN